MPLTLEQLRDESRKLANELFSTEVVKCVHKESCIHREESRDLTVTERRRGWACRSFDAYEIIHMCSGCRAYWYAEMAAQSLHRVFCLHTKTETINKAKEQSNAASELGQPPGNS